MTIRTVFKSPNAVKRVQVDWTDWLKGANITASSFTADAGLNVQSQGRNGAVCEVFLTGGTLKSVYNVVNQITDSLGRVEERTFRVSVIQT
jgi:hypothetical protein